MKRLARQWKKSLRPNADDDDFSLPTIDDARPIDTQEQEEVVRSLEQMHAQQSRLWRTVFAGLLSCYVAFLLFNIHHQAAYPWELVKSLLVPSLISVLPLIRMQRRLVMGVCIVLIINPGVWKVVYIWLSLPPSLRYHAYFMEDIDSRLVIFSDWLAVVASLTAILGLVRNSERHRRWIWCSFFGGIVLSVFWLYYMLRLPKFRWDVIWLPFGPLSGAVICLYVDHLLNESSEEVRKLRSYMYAYKAS